MKFRRSSHYNGFVHSSKQYSRKERREGLLQARMFPHEKRMISINWFTPTLNHSDREKHGGIYTKQDAARRDIYKVSEGGFTLLETIVAVGILTTGILSIVGLMSYNLSQAQLLKNRVVAGSLAAEGIEIARNIRDSNWLKGKAFNEWDQLPGQASDLSTKLSPLGNLFFDDFNRNNNDILGAPWTERGGTAAFDFDIINNKVELVTVANQNIFHTTAISTADYSVQADFTPSAGANFLGVCGRRVNFGAIDSDRYALFANESADRLYLYKRISGVWSNLAQVTTPINPGIRYSIKLSMQGQTIKGFLNGAEVMSVTDTSLIGPGDACGDTGTGAGGVSRGSTWDNFSIDKLPPDNVTALARASNGDIYVGAANGRFGKYVPGTNTFTDLTVTSGLSAFWESNTIWALAYDTTNNVVYLGGGPSRKFAKYTVGMGLAADLTSLVNFGSGSIGTLAMDNASGVVYIGSDNGPGPFSKFAKYDTTSGTPTDLDSAVNAIFGGGNIYASAIDTLNGVIYLTGTDSKFAKYTISSNTATNLTSLITGLSGWQIGSMYAISLDSTNGAVYLGGYLGQLAKYTISSNIAEGGNSLTIGAWGCSCDIFALAADGTNGFVYVGAGSGKIGKYETPGGIFTNLTGKIGGFWGANSVGVLTLDTKDMLYLAGDEGKFAKCEINFNCGSGDPCPPALPCVYAGDYENPALTTAAIAADTFDRGDSPNMGPVWIERGSGGIDISIVANKAKFIDGGSGAASVAYYNGITYSSPDYSVQATINHNGNTACTFLGVVGRRVHYGTNDSNGYYGFAGIGSCPGVYIYRRIAGGWNQLAANPTVTINNTQDYTVKLEMSGSTLRLYLDGILQLTTSDSSLAAAGDAGISAGTGGSPNVLWDNFLVNTVNPFISKIYFDTGTNAYRGSASATTIDTPFSREIIISDNPDGNAATIDAQIESIVTWSIRGKSYNAKIEERLYDWK